MAQIIDFVPNDAEMEAYTTPKNQQAANELAHKKEVKKRLEAYLERAQLKRDLSEDDFWA
ncbi:PA3496 family putative envelope integrity protein [Shewanella sp. 125m-7]